MGGQPCCHLGEAPSPLAFLLSLSPRPAGLPFRGLCQFSDSGMRSKNLPNALRLGNGNSFFFFLKASQGEIHQENVSQDILRLVSTQRHTDCHLPGDPHQQDVSRVPSTRTWSSPDPRTSGREGRLAGDAHSGTELAASWGKGQLQAPYCSSGDANLSQDLRQGPHTQVNTTRGTQPWRRQSTGSPSWRVPLSKVCPQLQMWLF